MKRRSRAPRAAASPSLLDTPLIRDSKQLGKASAAASVAGLQLFG